METTAPAGSQWTGRARIVRGMSAGNLSLRQEDADGETDPGHDGGGEPERLRQEQDQSEDGDPGKDVEVGNDVHGWVQWRAKRPKVRTTAAPTTA